MKMLSGIFMWGRWTCNYFFFIQCLNIGVTFAHPSIKGPTCGGNYSQNTTLTCTEKGFDPSTGYHWKKGDQRIYTNAGPVLGIDKYIHRDLTDGVALIVINTTLDDVDNYTCEYMFKTSDIFVLKVQSPVSEENSICSEQGRRLNLVVGRLYPKPYLYTVSCSDSNGTPVPGKTTAAEVDTSASDLFDFRWSTNNQIETGSAVYTCVITVQTECTHATRMTCSTPAETPVIGSSRRNSLSVVAILSILLGYRLLH